MLMMIIDVPTTPSTRTTVETLFTPAEQKPQLKPLPKLQVTSQQPVNNQKDHKHDVKPAEEMAEHNTKEHALDKENSSVDQKTQNGG